MALPYGILAVGGTLNRNTSYIPLKAGVCIINFVANMLRNLVNMKSSLISVYTVCLFIKTFQTHQMLQMICSHFSTVFIINKFVIVLPAKSDSDVMFCLHHYQGLIIDRSLVY